MRGEACGEIWRTKDDSMDCLVIGNYIRQVLLLSTQVSRGFHPSISLVMHLRSSRYAQRVQRQHQGYSVSWRLAKVKNVNSTVSTTATMFNLDESPLKNRSLHYCSDTARNGHKCAVKFFLDQEATMLPHVASGRHER